MIHTLDFIYDLSQDAAARDTILHWLECPNKEPVHAGPFRLEHLPGTGTVRISLQDQTYPFRWKCPEYVCPAKELAELIRKVCKKHP